MIDLSDLKIIDHHAHALFHEAVWRSTPLEAYLSEAYDPVMLDKFVPHNVFALRSYRELAGFYGCEPTRQAVLEARAKWDYSTLCRTMLAQSGIEEIYVDDGIWLDQMQPLDQNMVSIGVPCKRVLRLETELANLIVQYDSYADVLTAFERHLYALAPTLIGFKSIIAYRSGLEVMQPTPNQAEAAFTAFRRGLSPTEIAPRVADKVLLDSALWVGLRVAAETGLPIQFHTAYGDPDLDLRLANPLHLRGILESPELRGLRLVMLHCYPFMREAGYLASVYSSAYLDIGLTIPYLSTHAMRTSILEALHLAPISKVLFSTDASRTPELFWLAARHGRRMVAAALEQMVADTDLTTLEAQWAAERILRGNSLELYR